MSSKQVAEIKRVVKIHNFTADSFKVGDSEKFIFSIFPDYSSVICKFTVHVYPRGNNADNSDYVSVYFGGILTDIFSVQCTLSVLDVDHNLVLFQSFENNGENVNFGLDRFILRNTLLERHYELLPDNTLTISFEITYYYAIPNLLAVDQKVIEFHFLYVLSLHAYDKCTESEMYFLQGNDDGCVVPVKRSVLCHHSPVFARMLASDMVESKKDCVKIPDVSRWSLLRLVYFFISSEIVFKCTDDLYDLYIIADKYAVESLLSKCRRYLKSNIDYESICYLLIFSDFHNDHVLKTFALSYIVSCYHEVSNTAEWKYMMQNNQDLAQEITFYVSTNHPDHLQETEADKNDSKLLNSILAENDHVLEHEVEAIVEELNEFDFYQ
ncbi:TD and POZ domain-containing protein 4, partial [Stegodyphus mimosarum]